MSLPHLKDEEAEARQRVPLPIAMQLIRGHPRFMPRPLGPKPLLFLIQLLPLIRGFLSQQEINISCLLSDFDIITMANNPVSCITSLHARHWFKHF